MKKRNIKKFVSLFLYIFSIIVMWLPIYQIEGKKYTFYSGYLYMSGSGIKGKFIDEILALNGGKMALKIGVIVMFLYLISSAFYILSVLLKKNWHLNILSLVFAFLFMFICLETMSQILDNILGLVALAVPAFLCAVELLFIKMMDVIELAAEKPKPEFHFRYGRTPGKMLFETHDLVTGYDEPLSKPLNFSMERGQKIALVGTNGIGKTTLLKSILGLIPSLSGSCELGENLEIGYFEQEVKGENKTTCIDEIWQEFPSFTQYEVRSALAKCGLTTKHIESQVRVLSGGEQAKVRLCKLINRDTNILLLDEPTNHLDVDAKDSLKKALQEYRGSILLICHEPEFYQDVVNEVWDMSKWTTKVF